MEDISLQEVLDVSVEVAYKAGGMMLAASRSIIESNQKKNRKMKDLDFVFCAASFPLRASQSIYRIYFRIIPQTNNFYIAADLVTATDHAIEHMISQRLTICFPNIDFLGEEAYSKSSSPSALLTSRPTFICDPIDGTMNFVHSHRQFCVSLGLAIDKEPVLGVIYDPMTQALYYGVRGQGAFVSVAGGGWREDAIAPALDQQSVRTVDLDIEGLFGWSGVGLGKEWRELRVENAGISKNECTSCAGTGWSDGSGHS